MILNRTFTYFLCFFIVYTPFRPVKAFVPLVPAVVALTGQAALWTGRQLITRMAVNYGTQAGVVATAAVATTPLIKDYMASDYALKPWGSWAWLLSESGFISNNGDITIREDDCFQNEDCGMSHFFKMSDGSIADDFDPGLYNTAIKLSTDCPVTAPTDDFGQATLYDCAMAVSAKWRDEYRSKPSYIEENCNDSNVEFEHRKSCFSKQSMDFWGMSDNALILHGRIWVVINETGKSPRIAGQQNINEVELLFPNIQTKTEIVNSSVVNVLKNQLVDNELPLHLIEDVDLSYCDNDSCYSLPSQHFVANSVVIPVDENDVPIPDAVGGSSVSLPSGRPLPPISDPIYADAINSGLTGVPTGDPDTDAIVEDLIKPIFDAPAPIVQQPTVNPPVVDPPITNPPVVNPPITNPPVQGSAVTVSNLSGIETRLDTVNNNLSSLNVDVDSSGVENRIDRTNELVEGLSTSTVPINLVPDKGQASSFWDSRYPDGFAGVWNNYNNNFQNTALVGWVDSFKLTYSSDGTPSWSMCFDLGFVDFGCHVIDIDSRVWLAIRAFILFTSVMLARRLVFGG
ncbi:hypothetical protein AB4455_24740 [Vibrio sp. 10N.261.46.E12]|uniref:hypothetical protein n=1 Tax=unclassified Vibrio TaxID=2614977 RepID=UPI000978ADF9|nr:MULTISPECIES: hypothetical protein [unclassified Vibrio]OMO38021.1 hypothetical protein BH584_19900 [Vibrio sp. 10N.261.45.E1]PMJ32500.1 hypothetical protein BCU27_25390 [Vibrio sp. 10N.286.45.B6]PML90668.1 hypothetical protein BCT66_05280 [Vibrio sp. 10N.261.49.E11]PMM67589.1 hypothetical protein BCT48_14400 [Vibrio sp. 10N.261.46.F12]PMM80579.1 hypothetical protein BCT46_17310 [Vibrio sp. 10N.261.46.E8]